ncbi:HNH endonuclease [Longispora sp. NPDC051575]|uniref:HNH endonuclease n=1 Tax=Longispora sp. NPDC051575 TaxID=3154943 RepID=UPI00342D827D
MTLAEVTRPDVLAALAEFDRVGREEFLASAGFGTAREYFIEHDGQRYDSKAIVGYAHGVSQGVPLRSGDFTGGDKSVATLLRNLGFVVRQIRNPDWTRDEIVLACDLVVANDWKLVGVNDPRVSELSDLLQTAAIHPVAARGDRFRNPAGVARKTSDIATRHPSYTGAPTHGNRLDEEVLLEFMAQPEEMRAYADALRAEIEAGEKAERPPVADPDLEGHSADEGRVLQRLHLRRERDPKLKSAKLAAAKRQGQAIACEVCGFDFRLTYGPRGEDYIECHHRTPLSVSGPTRTRIEDLALICSNCHRMIHRKADDWLTVEQLAALVGEQRAQR